MDFFTSSFQGFADFQEKHFEGIPLSGCFWSSEYAILVQKSRSKRYLAALLVSIFTNPYSWFLARHNKDKHFWMTHTHKNLKIMSAKFMYVGHWLVHVIVHLLKSICQTLRKKRKVKKLASLIKGVYVV